MYTETWYNNTNCTDLSIEQLRHANLARGLTAVFCVVVCAVVLLFILYNKAFSSTFQRLLLYLLTGTMIVEIIGALNLEQQFHFSGQENMCVWLGFLINWAGLTMMSLEFGITVCLLCLVAIRFWGASCAAKLSKSTLFHCLGEAMFIMLPLLGALGLSLWTYLDGKFGLAGPWCWIKSVDDDCRPYGFQFQMVYYGSYAIIGVLGLTASIIFSIVYWRLSKTFREARQLVRRTLSLMIFQIVSILTLLVPLSLRLNTGLADKLNVFAFWIAYAVISPMRQLVVPLGVLICFYPIKSMFISTFPLFRTNEQIYKCRHEKVRGVSEKVTAPESTRVSPYSHTYFVPLHESEETYRNTDTGYGSTGGTQST